jgi:hypothetical protein
MRVVIRQPFLKLANAETNGQSILTRRRGDAEISAEKAQARQSLKTQRQRRSAGWRFGEVRESFARIGRLKPAPPMPEVSA